MSKNKLPFGWEIATIGDVAETIRGVTYKKENSRHQPGDGLFPVLRATNINGKLDFDDLVYVPQKCVGDLQILRLGDIVIAASSGSKSVVGKAARLTVEWQGSFGAFCMAVRPSVEIRPSFLAYFMETPSYRHRVSELSAGVNINNLKREHIEETPFPVPPLLEQDRIVAEIETLLTDLDAAVAALRRVQANLKRYRASVLKAACEGRLVPTEAELARKERRTYETGEQLLARILRERRAKWESDQLAKMLAAGKPPKNDDWKKKYKEPEPPDTTNLPELPEGWTWAAVEQVSTAVQYGTSAKCTDEGGVAVLRMGNLTSEGQVDASALKFLPSDHFEFPGLLLNRGDLLFNRTNSAELVGKSAVYQGDPSPCSFASYLIRVVLFNGCVPDYVAACLNSAYGRAWIKAVVNQQVGQANVNGTKLQGFVFPMPPTSEQERIVQRIDEAFSISSSAQNSVIADIKRADRLRQSILKRAFEGKLVPQDPNEEPASVLLERIRSQRLGINEAIGRGAKQTLKARVGGLE